MLWVLFRKLSATNESFFSGFVETKTYLLQINKSNDRIPKPKNLIVQIFSFGNWNSGENRIDNHGIDYMLGQQKLLSQIQIEIKLKHKHRDIKSIWAMNLLYHSIDQNIHTLTRTTNCKPAPFSAIYFRLCIVHAIFDTFHWWTTTMRMCACALYGTSTMCKMSYNKRSTNKMMQKTNKFKAASTSPRDQTACMACGRERHLYCMAYHLW